MQRTAKQRSASLKSWVREGRRGFVIGFLLLLALTLGACGGGEPAASSEREGPLQAVATVGHLGDIVANVGGEHVMVTSLMGAGVDPHLYVATESDVEALQQADVIFYNGLFLEAQMTDVMEQLAERKPVTAVGETIPADQLLPWANYADEFDPHIWFDVTLWMQAVEAVRATLTEVDPENAAAYEANAAAYLAELNELHTYVQEQIATIPESQRVLITAHDAFTYFGQAYGFDVRGLQGISTATEASTADVQALVDFIVENEIPAIFIESSVPVRNVEALQAAARAQGWEVAIGGELFSDAMGNPGTPEGTYIGMVRHNIDTIAGALQGAE
jgi:manganese/zinc/iron transport system substrate-binding protein